MNTCPRHSEAFATAFPSAADAWFWTVRALRARRDRTSTSGTTRKRPCDPDDIMCCLDRLYRSRRIELRHAWVLQHWGEQQVAPDTRMNDGRDALLWLEAMRHLEQPLRAKGIVRAKEYKPR